MSDECPECRGCHALSDCLLGAFRNRLATAEKALEEMKTASFKGITDSQKEWDEHCRKLERALAEEREKTTKLEDELLWARRHERINGGTLASQPKEPETAPVVKVEG